MAVIEKEQLEQQISEKDYKALVLRLKRFEFRMRIQEMVRILPFAFLIGGGTSLAVALYSRVIPSFTVEQALIIAESTLLIFLVSSICYALFRPRTILDTAKRADRMLGLKERTSTALEGYNSPKKLDYVIMGVRQFQDAKTILEETKLRKAFPLRVEKKSGLFALALIPLLALALFLPNSAALLAKENEALGQQVDKEAQKIEGLKNQIKEEAKKYNLSESDPKLQELLKQLDTAKKDIQDNKFNREQTLASIDKANQELSKLGDTNQAAQKAAFESLANDLKKYDSTRAAGNALSQSNDPSRFDNAADQLQKVAANIDKLKNDPAQAQTLADSLAQNAKNFENSDKAMADALNKSAQQLSSDNLKQNPAGAQQALRDLANQTQQAGKNQQFQEQLQQAQSQLQKSEQAISNAGKQNQDGTNVNSKPGTQAQDFGNQEDLGQLGDSSQNGDTSTDGQQQASQQQGQEQQGSQGNQSKQSGNGQTQGDGQGDKQAVGDGSNGQGNQQGQGQGKGVGQDTQNSNQGQGQGKGAGKGSVDNVYQSPTKRNGNGTQQNLRGKNGDGPTQSTNTNNGGAAGNT